MKRVIAWTLAFLLALRLPTPAQDSAPPAEEKPWTQRHLKDPVLRLAHELRLYTRNETLTIIRMVSLGVWVAAGILTIPAGHFLGPRMAMFVGGAIGAGGLTFIGANVLDRIKTNRDLGRKERASHALHPDELEITTGHGAMEEEKPSTPWTQRHLKDPILRIAQKLRMDTRNKTLTITRTVSLGVVAAGILAIPAALFLGPGVAMVGAVAIAAGGLTFMGAAFLDMARVSRDLDGRAEASRKRLHDALGLSVVQGAMEEVSRHSPMPPQPPPPSPSDRLGLSDRIRAMQQE